MDINKNTKQHKANAFMLLIETISNWKQLRHIYVNKWIFNEKFVGSPLFKLSVCACNSFRGFSFWPLALDIKAVTHVFRITFFGYFMWQYCTIFRINTIYRKQYYQHSQGLFPIVTNIHIHIRKQSASET